MADSAPPQRHSLSSKIAFQTTRPERSHQSSGEFKEDGQPQSARGASDGRDQPERSKSRSKVKHHRSHSRHRGPEELEQKEQKSTVEREKKEQRDKDRRRTPSRGHTRAHSGGGGGHRRQTSASVAFNTNILPQSPPTSVPDSHKRQVRTGQVGSHSRAASTGGLIPLINLALDPQLLIALPHHRPWKPLLVCLAIAGLYIAALICSAIGLPLPSYTGSNIDYFTSVAWVLFVAGLVVLIGASLALIVRGHPFFGSVLVAYFFSELLLLVATVLLTSRLNATARDLFTNYSQDSAILSVQLSWVGSILYFAWMCWLLCGSATASLHMPDKAEFEKYSLLLTMREMAKNKLALVRELDEQEAAKASRDAHAALQQKSDRQAMDEWHMHRVASAPADASSPEPARSLASPSMDDVVVLSALSPRAPGFIASPRNDEIASPAPASVLGLAPSPEERARSEQNRDQPSESSIAATPLAKSFAVIGTGTSVSSVATVIAPPASKRRTFVFDVPIREALSVDAAAAKAAAASAPRESMGPRVADAVVEDGSAFITPRRYSLSASAERYRSPSPLESERKEQRTARHLGVTSASSRRSPSGSPTRSQVGHTHRRGQVSRDMTAEDL